MGAIDAFSIPMPPAIARNLVQIGLKVEQNSTDSIPRWDQNRGGFSVVGLKQEEFSPRVRRSQGGKAQQALPGRMLRLLCSQRHGAVPA